MTIENSTNTTLLRVENLMMHFPIRRGVFQRQVGAVRAVDGVSFDVQRGETLGLVGESGCGKSTTGRTILQLYKPTAGEVHFEGVNLVTLKGEQLRHMRRKMQMIFQDPYASLNPRMTVGQLVGEPLMVHSVATGAEINDRVMHLLELVKLNPAFASRYPHEFSGGQRQRIGLARALALQPSLSSVMNRSRPSTFPFRPRSSTCWRNCRSSSTLPISSSPTTFPWSSTSATALR